MSSNLDLTLTAFNSSILNSASGRDKLGKLVHYFARGVAGTSEELRNGCEKGSAEYMQYDLVYQKSRSLFVRLMEARRTNRWLTGLNIYYTIIKPVPKPWNESAFGVAAFYLSQMGMFWWTTLDHLRWIYEVKLIQGDPKRMKRISFTGFVMSAAVSTIFYLKLYLEKAGLSQNESKDTSKVDLSGIKLNLFKSVLNLICTLHISEMYISHEAICGFAGAIVAAIDLHAMYPRKNKTS